jgi:type II secretory pathway pseudopilin PulG
LIGFAEMTNSRMTNAENYRPRCFVILSSFVLRHSSFRSAGAFTIAELLVVIAIIIVLAGLVLTTSGYVQTRSKRSRAEAEIAALSAALENYKADNGIHPTDTASGSTNALDARTMFNPTAAQYSAASLFLYKELSGDPTGNRAPTGKSYFPFKPNMLLPKDQAQAVIAIADPFGHSYGYSTANQANPSKGYNPTFDLWSTAGTGNGPTPDPSPQEQWIKNW